MREIVLCLALACGSWELRAQNQFGTNRATAPRPAPAGTRFEFKDGDRIVFLGDGWMAGEQKDGYVETMLTSRLGGKKAIFRNLAWSVDSAPGHSRADLNRSGKELKRRNELLRAIKPTVAFLAYGTLAASNREAGVDKFKGEIKTLMDTITNICNPEPVRFVLVTPLLYETPPGATSEATTPNTQLELYAQALRDIAAERDAHVVDLFAAMRKDHSRPGAQNWTDDGNQPTAEGYWRIAGVFERALMLSPGIPRMGIGRNNSIRHGGAGVKPENITRTETTIRLTGKDEFVFQTLQPKRPGQTNGLDGLWIQFYPLPPGEYTLRIDGQICAVHSSAQWMQAALVRHGPLFERAEALRWAIIKKNELWSQRWPLDYRKSVVGSLNSKGGKEAKPGPLSDPLISAEEEKIFGLLELKARLYELMPSQPGDAEKLHAEGSP